MEAITDAVQMPEQTPMQRLGLAAERVAALRAELKLWTEDYKAALEAVLAGNPTFARSRMGSEIYKDGPVGLIRKEKVVRKLQQYEFYQAAKEDFALNANLSIENAEKIAKAHDLDLEEFIDRDRTYQYKVVDLRGPGR